MSKQDTCTHGAHSRAEAERLAASIKKRMMAIECDRCKRWRVVRDRSSTLVRDTIEHFGGWPGWADRHGIEGES